jgi:NRPS condensation-like uncharacterized protein|tara:strand:- start:182 stop:388 length:207 start_codon:yes stop_codon:yes gene_type:complete
MARRAKKKSTVISIRIPDDIMLRVRQQAEEENRTINNLLITYLSLDINFSTTEHRAKLEAKERTRRRR